LASSARPLAGRGILIARPLERAGRLAALVRQAGGTAYLYPALGIAPPVDDAPARERLSQLDVYDLVLFVSPTAVERAFEMIPRWPGELTAAAVGPGTRAALEEHGVRKVLAPRAAADREALLALPELAEMAGRRVLIARGEGGRELAADTLRRRGATVDYAECYRRVPPAPVPDEIVAALSSGRIHGTVAASAATVENLFAAFAEPAAQHLRRAPIFVPHARVAQAAERAGAAEVVLAGSSDAEVLERLVAYFGTA